MFRKLFGSLLVFAIWGSAWQIADAKVVRIEIDQREDLLQGQAFPDVGPYEILEGRVFFAFDPDNPLNSRIVDLGLAPRNADGAVEAWANFTVLRPSDLPKELQGFALLEVSNRGGKASLRYFNRAGQGAPYGDRFLMRQGITMIWVGWQFDVPEREGVLRLHVPTVTDGGTTIDGLVRCDWVVDEPTQILQPGHRNHRPYAVLDPKHPDNVLTVRSGRLAERQVVDRSKWHFVAPANQEIRMEDGFEPGKIYELVYRGKDPVVVGLGLAAVRDMMSYAKYDSQCPFPVQAGFAFGVSQTGRFLRQFVYQGFNTDENKRQVFDGLMVHTAGAGRGSFNHRFGQPSRDAHRYSAFFYPTDIFPFSSRIQWDPTTGKRDGLFAHSFDPSHLPKIFYTNTGYEYWGRAASLIHTSLDGSADVELYGQERLYHLSSAQHFVSGFPPQDSSRMREGIYRTHPLDFFYTLRALLLAMKNWVQEGTEPPPSAYPRIDEGTLIGLERLQYPAIPDVRYPKVIHEAYRADYGLRWDHGIIDRQPPVLGPAFQSLVSQVDGLGNEIAGVRSVETLVPLATYLPWNLREGFPGGTDELTNFVGTYIPLSRTESEKERRADPRPSIESLYSSREDFLAKTKEAAGNLVRRGFLLKEDVDHVLKRAEERWDWVFGH